MPLHYNNNFSFNTFFNSAKWIFLLNLINKGIGFFISILLARLILPKEFGSYYYLLACIETLTIFISIGINTSIIQNTKHPEDSFQQTGFLLSVVCVLFYMLLVYICGQWIIKINLAEYYLMAAAKSIFMFSGVHGIILQKGYKFRVYHQIIILSNLISYSAAIILAYKQFGLKALVYQYLIMHVLLAMLVIASSDFRIQLNQFKKEYIRVFIRQGKELYFISAIGKLLEHLDILIIQQHLGKIAIGYYKRSISMTNNLQALFIKAFEQLFLVSYADLQSNKSLSIYLLNQGVWLTVRISALILCLINCCPEKIIVLLYGENWSIAANIIPWISLFLILNPVRNQFRSYFLANGAFISLRNIHFIEIVLFIIFLLTGIKYGGIIGAATGLSLWIVFSLGIYFRKIDKNYLKKSMDLFLLPVSVLLAIILLNKIIPQKYVAPLYILKMMAGTFLYLFFLFLIERKEIAELFNKIRG